jgi:23S rRNA pseudouridine1911/1915/1917 synthase
MNASNSKSPKHYRFTPTPEEAGMRLDQFVPAKTDELSRTLLRKIVDIGGAHVGGRRVRRCSLPVRAGEEVVIHIDGLPLEPYVLRPEDVLMEDDYLLAVAKPAGVETQPTPARYRGTLYAALLDHLHNPHRPLDRPELGMAQRLDRDTSGVMVFSIHRRAHGRLTEIIAGREAEKSYLALVSGHPAEKEGEIRSLLARNRATNRVRSVAKGGKEAITRYRVLEEFADSSLLEVQLLTGRSHQIRAHLFEAGHPLVGDARYGGPRFLREREIPRQMLHARRLTLPHPVTGEALTLEAPVPEDMGELLESMGFSFEF